MWMLLCFCERLIRSFGIHKRVQSFDRRLDSPGKDTYMRRSGFFITTLLLMAVLMGVGIFFLIRSKGDSWKSTWNRTVSVKNGKTDPGEIVVDFTIEKSGDYVLRLSWNLEGQGTDLSKASEDGPGFVTGCVITDPAGNVIYGTSATAVYLDTQVSLEPGTHRITYTYISNEEDYIEYAKKYLCAELSAKDWAKNFDFTKNAKDGTWNIDYEMKVGTAASGSSLVFLALFIILVSVSVSVILLIAVSRDRRLQSPQYDERQELERGRGFRYGFFTMLIFNGGVLCFDMMDLIPGKNQMVLYASGLFAGILVYGVYCIWNDSYFALNQKANVCIAFFTFIGLFNLAIAVTAILKGTMIENGRATEKFLNLECAILFLILMATMLIKKVYDKKTGDTAGDEE